MTTYTPGDLNQDWEFKIVRANRPVFRSPTHLNRLLEQEAQAGWVMVEKFDNMRVRFKRPRQARLDDPKLPHGVDPYRVHYGMPPGAFAALLILTMFGLIAGIFVSIYLVFAP